MTKLRHENGYQNYPYKTFHPLRRRPLRDIDPGTVDQWETTRVTLLGDAVHAMNPWFGIGSFSIYFHYLNFNIYILLKLLVYLLYLFF